MVTRGRGTIVNLGSVAGREPYPKGHGYCATKHAVRALTAAIRMDLVDTPVRLTEIQPGMVETEFSLVRFHGDAERAKRTYRNFPPLTPLDVAEAILFCVTRPPQVSIHELQIMPQAQAAVLVTRK
jgi:NADP-dependent 3-hydroxy acid dehydrogenase YdfG